MKEVFPDFCWPDKEVNDQNFRIRVRRPSVSTRKARPSRRDPVTVLIPSKATRYSHSEHILTSQQKLDRELLLSC